MASDYTTKSCHDQQLLSGQTFVARSRILFKPMVEKRDKSSKAKTPRHLAFGRRLVSAWPAGLTIEEAAKLVGCSKNQMVKYRKGEALPRPDRMKKLGVAVNKRPAWLQYGENEDPDAPEAPIAASSPDEQFVIKKYRRLPPGAQKLLRHRLVELEENFAPPSNDAPFGQGRRPPNAE